MIDGFNEAIHVSARLRVCSILAEVAKVEFGVVRDSLGLSDSALSEHLCVLENAGFVVLRKGVVDRPTRTWGHLTRGGRSAFRAHVGALRVLAASTDVPGIDNYYALLGQLMPPSHSGFPTESELPLMRLAGQFTETSVD